MESIRDVRLSDNAADPKFAFGIRVGILFITEAASLSAISVAGLLLYILYSTIAIRKGAARSWKYSTHIHYYFVSLLVADLIQATGGVLDAKWVAEGMVTEGPFCTAQGVLKQIGDVGVALSTMAIAVNTFIVLVFQWQSPTKVAAVVVGLIWLFITLIVAITFAKHRNQNYFGNTQYWCWISAEFGAERIGLEYAWLWTAAIVNIICYIFIALIVQGVLVVDKGRLRRRGSRDPRASTTTSTYRKRHSAVMAMQMLFYPAVYIVTVTPISITRWIDFSSAADLPFAATCFSGICFNLSGFLNVLLFTLTRPGLVPNRVNRRSVENPHIPISITSTTHSVRDSVSPHSLQSPPRAYQNELEDWKDPAPSSPGILLRTNEADKELHRELYTMRAGTQSNRFYGV
ncbi:hypothetical protein CYLTODRAFT_387202 [Cylindrobasidium torrendii FP15055 ss-10]|uniref:Uncharacterized protein n=1 Tax=Cylindrobasidium torrendii FP15055 ss-10 TaxID=1314674 RepID=A0A0D7BSR8_9AGAR|nr:hypothetical protein CYLTODRAFT_387202 [Cylindrobasidium torrendii FP15055 ss-10]